MTSAYDGSSMDQQPRRAGSVKRARERAAAKAREQLPPPDYDDYETSPEFEHSTTPLRPMPSQPSVGQRPARPRQAPAIESRTSPIISRPARVPQWPLPGPISSPTPQPDASPYRPPPGRPQRAPQRPPRPSQVPSIVDKSRLQGSTPVFYSPDGIPMTSPDGALSPQYSSYQDAITPASSARLTSSSIGTIPDFPAPAVAPSSEPPAGPVIPPRRSANLGPPPSSRRGASSFYSSVSFVSPIPEESLRTRSHLSYASSAAMPSNWQTDSAASSPSYSEAFFDDSISEQNKDYVYEELGDESKLVRSASIGKKGKPALIDTRSSSANRRPSPQPVQPFDGGTGYIDASSSSSNTLPTTMRPRPARLADPPRASLGNAMDRESTMQETTEHLDGTGLAGAAAQSGRKYNRLSAIRRPPRLDMDAVRDAEARGSLTSLPDLIRRATRLAAMIDGGKRPASRFEDLSEFLTEKGGRDTTRDTHDDEHQSGLADMLAAFPPPAQNDRSSRLSWFRASPWPMGPRGEGGMDDPMHSSSDQYSSKKKRRCCGVPMWLFIFLVLLALSIVVVAVVVPLQLLVFNNEDDSGEGSQSSLERCEETLACLNGGTNVFSQGVCSCICTNGFTGTSCNEGTSAACTITNLVSPDGRVTVGNVTLGSAVPRLIADALGNFSVPLSGTAILAKFSYADLSCIAQNSLVTFNGKSTRSRGPTTRVESLGDAATNAEFDRANFESSPAITVAPDLSNSAEIGDTENVVTVDPPAPTTTSTYPDALVQDTRPAPTPTGESSATSSSIPSQGFVTTEQMLDFARVSVLLVLQEQSTDAASEAQTLLQAFFTKASESEEGDEKAVSRQASNLDIGGDNTINLVDLQVSVNDGASSG